MTRGCTGQGLETRFLKMIPVVIVEKVGTPNFSPSGGDLKGKPLVTCLKFAHRIIITMGNDAGDVKRSSDDPEVIGRGN